MKTLKALIWHAPPWRAMLEALLVSSLFILLAVQVLETAPDMVTNFVIFLYIAVYGTLAALRLRPFQGRRLNVIIKETSFALVLTTVAMLVLVALLAAFGQLKLLEKSYLGIVVSFFSLALGIPGFLGLRVIGWLWMRWDVLRQQRYVWELTHALLSVVVLAASTLFLSGSLYLIIMSFSNPYDIPSQNVIATLIIRTLLWISIWLAAAFGVTFIALFFLLPPAALFSYLVARRLTRRLEALARTARALRSGDLSTRVNVEGQDEVAQLQMDINAMAADLENYTQALQIEKEKVSTLLKTQRELTAGISHELRTPVATLSGYLDSLRRRDKTRSQKSTQRDLETMAHELERMNVIIEDLFTLARTEVNQLSLSIQSVEIGSIVYKVIDTLAPLAWQTGKVQVTADIKSDFPQVSTDPIRLEQVLGNLLHNAIRYTPPGGLVVTTGQVEEEWVRLDVIDTGEGINPEDLPHIWERFYHGNDRNGIGGTGLGLALVKELVEAMGGKVSVESISGEGSRFSVYLPIASPSPDL